MKMYGNLVNSSKMRIKIIYLMEAILKIFIKKLIIKRKIKLNLNVIILFQGEIKIIIIFQFINEMKKIFPIMQKRIK